MVITEDELDKIEVSLETVRSLVDDLANAKDVTERDDLISEIESVLEDIEEILELDTEDDDDDETEEETLE